MARLPDLAYYYPEPYWEEKESAQLKSLLLFFDKIGILLPRYMYGQHHSADISLARPLRNGAFWRYWTLLSGSGTA